MEFFFSFFCSAREQTAVATGLVGCIRMLDVNNRVLNLQENGGDSLYGSGVGECGNNPCQPNPCKNGGACQVKEAEMFHCKCSKGFWGEMGKKVGAPLFRRCGSSVSPVGCWDQQWWIFSGVHPLNPDRASQPESTVQFPVGSHFICIITFACRCDRSKVDAAQKQHENIRQLFRGWPGGLVPIPADTN